MTLALEDQLTEEDLALPCDYPEWSAILWVDYPEAEDCDAPAEFVVTHHHCKAPNRPGTTDSVVLVCEEHLEAMIAVRDVRFRAAWAEGGDGLKCEACQGGADDPQAIFTYLRLG